MKLSEIQIRDPFVLPVKKRGEYFLFGSTDKNVWSGPGVGFDCYRSRDLENWDGPTPAFRPPKGFWGTTQFWAAEVHEFQGRFFLFATFKADGQVRATQIFSADNPEGPFAIWSEEPVTPANWFCLDGTLHVTNDGTPWMVFCREWVEISNGTMVAIRLSDDLRRAIGEPITLFSASDAPWVRAIERPKKQQTSNAMLPDGDRESFVTDGPFLHRTRDGALLMLWSSFGEKGYAMGVAHSKSGNVLGPWTHEPEPLWKENGGHGMIFRSFDGELFLTLHHPNDMPNERAIFHRLVETAGSVRLAGVADALYSKPIHEAEASETGKSRHSPKTLMNLMKNLTPVVLLVVANVATAQITNSEMTNAPESAPAVPVLQINAAKVTAHVDPIHYGLMTEEINFSYEGGLYGELIRNRTFKANPTNAVYWSAIGDAAIAVDTNQPLNAALNVSLKLDTSKASKDAPVGIANGGYWGIPVRPNTTYHASLYAKAKKNFNGALTVSLQSADGKNIFASATIPKVSGGWKKYEVTLTTGNVEPSKENKLVITTTRPGNFFSKQGTVWFQQVSLFPPTYNNRPNGNRPDLMQLMADMKPKFLRFPGGNYVEGSNFKERFNWKETIGDISQRPGHRSPWNYWSTDGTGLLEFLGWCEDLKMEPVLAVFAGYTLKHERAKPGPELEPYVQEALEEIEYVTGGTNTKWGARRAKDGHPEPFLLRYVEIGNEDGFDGSGSYEGRYTQFHDAIKAKYPQLELISTVGGKDPLGARFSVKTRSPDLLDEHYYRSQEEMEAHALDYDQYPRVDKPKIFVGEWATRVGSPTPNMAGALGDAAWMTGMERNADVVTMHCYAPLFVNVSELRRGGSMQWPSDLIGYDALNSYGSPSYYAQVMFSNHHGDEILATDSQNIPMREWQPPARRNGTLPPAQQIRKLFFNATRDSKSGTVYLKIVNSLGTAQPVKIEIRGAAAIEPEGNAIVLKANNLDDTNTIQEPKKVVPVEEKASGLGANFMHEFPPYSITVLELKTK